MQRSKTKPRRHTRIDADAVFARVQREGQHALLTFGEATALLAARLMDEHDTARTARNRVAMQLNRACRGAAGASSGVKLVRVADGRFEVVDIAQWARGLRMHRIKDVPARLMDLPRPEPRPFDQALHDTIRMQDVLHVEVIPGDIVACQALVAQLRQQLRRERLERERADAERKARKTSNLHRKTK